MSNSKQETEKKLADEARNMKTLASDMLSDIENLDATDRAADAAAQADPPPATAAVPGAPQGSVAQAGVETPPEGGAALPGDAPHAAAAAPPIASGAAGNMSAAETPHRDYPDKPAPDPLLVRDYADRGDAPLIETPSQGAAVIDGKPIPNADAEPVKTVVDAADLAPAPVTFADPAAAVQSLRTKLHAYGEECLKAIQPEIEYLMNLHSPAAGTTGTTAAPEPE